MRLALSPVRRLWRDEETLQLGRRPGRSVVLAGLDPLSRAALALLDGTRDTDALLSDAESRGCPPGRTRELLDRLQEAGVLVDASERWPARLDLAERDRLSADAASLAAVEGGSGVLGLCRREAARVRVVGAGRVGGPLALLLAAAGVGAVDVVDEAMVRPRDVAPGGALPVDVGRERAAAVRARLTALAPSCGTGPAVHPDLVVLAPAGLLPDDRSLLLAGVPHLLAEVQDAVGVVGPLVVPGRSACLRCLDHTRTDHDPAWPVMSAQLSVAARQPEACDTVLAAAVSAQAALQVLALLGGETPPTLGGSLELVLPDWRWRRRSWPRHPACACHLLTA